MPIKWRMSLRGITVALFLMLMARATFADVPTLTYPVPRKAGNPAQEKARDFTLKDIQGRSFRLTEQKGNPVLLIFGATWCPYCIEEIPRLKNIFVTYSKRGLIMANVDIQESRNKVERFAERHKLPYRVLLDESAQVAKNYGVQGIPNLSLIDREGMIVCRQCQSVEPLLEKMFRQK